MKRIFNYIRESFWPTWMDEHRAGKRFALFIGFSMCWMFTFFGEQLKIEMKTNNGIDAKFTGAPFVLAFFVLVTLLASAIGCLLRLCELRVNDRTQTITFGKAYFKYLWLGSFFLSLWYVATYPLVPWPRNGWQWAIIMVLPFIYICVVEWRRMTLYGKYFDERELNQQAAKDSTNTSPASSN